MPKHTLAICHSAGDTQAILATAKVFAKREISTSVLVVGKTAKEQVIKALESLTTEKPWIKMLDIDNLCDAQPIANNLLSLSHSKLIELSEILKKQKFDGLLVGTPSYVTADQQCVISQQLLQQLAPHIPSMVFSDYAFYEPQHTLSKERWFTHAKIFLVPFKKAIEAFKANTEKTVVVGHPSIDTAKAKYVQWIKEEKPILEKIQDKFKKINLDPEQRFVFVAGGKSGDEVLIEALATACQNVPTLKIYIGVHPGAEQPYFEKLQAIIDQSPVGDKIKILPKNAIDTDEIVYLANGVISISSTVSTVAAACGKLSGYFQKGKDANDQSVPYIVADLKNAGFYHDQSQLITFLMDASRASNKMKLDDLKVEKAAAERIADVMENLMTPKQ